MATARMSIVWVDAAGAMSTRTITAQVSAAAILSAAQAYTNAQPLETWEGAIGSGYPAPSAAAYLSAGSVVYLVFTDGVGHNVTLALPGPSTSIFLPDGVSVDPTTIAPLIAACIGTLTTAAGTVVTAFVSGQLGPGRTTT